MMPVLLLPDEFLRTLSARLGQALIRRGWLCATAESCTGGLAGAVCTAVPGSSEWYAGGVVSYANDVKIRVLGVNATTLATLGAVSEAVVCQMACGVCDALKVHAGVSISGVAGPGGGSADKPVGTVWLGFCVHGAVDACCLHLPGNREEVRSAAVLHALSGLLERVSQSTTAPNTL